MKPLIPYMRQSRRKERTISIEEQRRAIEAWASASEVPLDREVVEQGVSGNKPWRERGLGEAVAACARGEAAGIIVAYQDRLSRENGLATAEVWEALDRAGARLVAAAEGLDTASGDQEMLFTIKAAIAREQWKRRRLDWENARRSAIEDGVFTGRCPYGYRARKGARKPLQVVAREAERVLAMYEARAAGESFTQIARRFGFSESTVRQMLSCETYLGVVRHGRFVNEHAHEPIIGRELFDAVQASRTTQPVATGELTQERLLVGIATCAHCGHTLKVLHRARADGSRNTGYYCKGTSAGSCPKPRPWVRADDLDAFVCEWFERALRTVPRMVDAVRAGQELAEAQAEHERLRRDLEQFVTVVIEDAAVFQRGLDVRQERVAVAEERVRHLSARRSRLPVGGTLLEVWASASPLERREILAGFLDRVEVHRGAGVPEGVRIFWQDGTVALLDVSDDEHGVGVAAA
jgi:DNA invertase Pin-like site-specific DNA recombinase